MILPLISGATNGARTLLPFLYSTITSLVAKLIPSGKYLSFKKVVAGRSSLYAANKSAVDVSSKL